MFSNLKKREDGTVVGFVDHKGPLQELNKLSFVYRSEMFKVHRIEKGEPMIGMVKRR